MNKLIVPGSKQALENLKTKYSINSIDELLDVIAGIMN